MNYDDWMPYNDNLPPAEWEYLVTWVAEVGIYGRTTFTGMEILEYSESEGWLTYDIVKRGFFNIRVTAWMELPEKYREDAE